MNYETRPDADQVRADLLHRLQALEGSQGTGTLAELAYRRAREALEKALEEARNLRLQAIDDARQTRDREMTSLMESMRSLRQSAEMQVEAVLAAADVEAARVRARAESDADSLLRDARAEAESLRQEAAAIRTAADSRARDVERLEAEFNEIAADIAKRIGLKDQPQGGWLSRLFRRR